MKKLAVSISLLLSVIANGQGFVNGSFETTTSTGCDYNNSIGDFNAVMSNVVMFSGTETDIHENGCYLTSIVDGIKAVGLAATDGINLELSTPLVAGQSYDLTFWKHANTSGGAQKDLEIGVTTNPSVMGTVVGTITSTAMDTWEQHTITFTPAINATHISAMNLSTGGWNQVDDFSIVPSCDPLTTSASATSLCIGEAVTLSATSPIGSIITWDSGVVDGIAFTPSIGTVTYTATSDNTDECSYSVDVTVHALPIVTASVDTNQICLGEEFTFTAGGADTYTWDMAVTDGIAIEPSIASTEMYTTTGTDINGCTNTASISATVHALPIVIAAVNDNEICLGDEFIFTASGADTYIWDMTVTDGVAIEPTVTSTETYTVIGTDINGCTNIDSVLATVYALPIVTAAVDFDSICFNDTILFTGSGATTYTWDMGVVNNELFTPQTEGTTTYTVIGTDDNGCENTDTINVTVNEEIMITYITTDEIIGADGAIDISVSGSALTYVFDWNTDGTGDFDDSEDLTDLTSGNYIVVAEGDDGCSTSEIITVNSQLGINETGINTASIYPNPTVGQVTITFSGSFTYTLYNIAGKEIKSGNGTNQTQLSLNEFSAGVYLIKIQNNTTIETLRLVKE